MMPYGIPDSYRFILASRSPRRQQLLKEAGLRFEVAVRDYNESIPSNLIGREIAEYLSREKAGSFSRSEIADNEIIITADTIVWCNNSVLDKPEDEKDALRILRTISGNTHEVITGVSLLSARALHTFSETTLVKFEKMSDEDIMYYISTCKPYDKAGAYGIQEWIGIIGNSYIEGSYFNVMGLPVHRLLTEIKHFISDNISTQK